MLAAYEAARVGDDGSKGEEDNGSKGLPVYIEPQICEVSRARARTAPAPAPEGRRLRKAYARAAAKQGAGPPGHTSRNAACPISTV